MGHTNFDRYLRDWVANLETETKILSHTYADIHAGQRIDLLVDHDVDTIKKKKKNAYCFWLVKTNKKGLRFD